MYLVDIVICVSLGIDMHEKLEDFLLKHLYAGIMLVAPATAMRRAQSTATY